MTTTTRTPSDLDVPKLKRLFEAALQADDIAVQTRHRQEMQDGFVGRVVTVVLAKGSTDYRASAFVADRSKTTLVQVALLWVCMVGAGKCPVLDPAVQNILVTALRNYAQDEQT